MNHRVPIIYAYVYSKLKENNYGNIVRTDSLKSILVQCVVRRKARGTTNKGIPFTYIYDIISDMEYFCLIKRIDKQRYKILSSKCEKKLNKFIF